MRIAFDVGNVLVNVDFEDFFVEFRGLGMREDPLTFLCDIQARQDIGIKTLDVALKSRFGLTEKEIEPLMKTWNSSIQPNQEMLDFVDTLKMEGTDVAILSNMGSEHAEYIRKEYPRIFDGCILHLSSEVGARKPTKLYYQSFLMQHPEFKGAIFLDDRPENLVAAEEFGLKGGRFELDGFIGMPTEKRQKVLQRIKKEIYETSKETRKWKEKQEWF